MFLPSMWSTIELVQEGPAQLDLGGHLHDLELVVLELGDGLAEGGPLLAVLDGHVQHAFRRRPRRRWQHMSRSCWSFSMSIRNPVPFWPSRLVLGDAAVVEKELGRVLAVPAHLLDLLALFKPGRAGLHQVEVDGLVGVCDRGVPGGQDQQVAVDAVADKGLLPVDDHVVPVLDRGGPHGGQVAPGVGLGHGDGGDDVAGDAAGKVFLFQLL